MCYCRYYYIDILRKYLGWLELLITLEIVKIYFLDSIICFHSLVLLGVGKSSKQGTSDITKKLAVACFMVELPMEEQ